MVRWDDAGDVLAAEAQRLQAGGADFVVLCTNTMHKVAAQIEAAIDIPMLNLADTTARAVLAAGVTRVGLLGTRFTMEQSFYRDRLAGHGIDVLVPGGDDIAVVNRVIYDELCLGIVRDESRSAYLDVIDRLVGAGAEGIVLGCTEIELLVRPEDVTVPAFPTVAHPCRGGRRSGSGLAAGPPAAARERRETGVLTALDPRLGAQRSES